MASVISPGGSMNGTSYCHLSSEWAWEPIAKVPIPLDLVVRYLGQQERSSYLRARRSPCSNA